jgi:hypothetical protein
MQLKLYQQSHLVLMERSAFLSDLMNDIDMNYTDTVHNYI